MYLAWQGFVVFATQPPEKEKIEEDTIDTSARVAKGLKTPGEPSITERRLQELTHSPNRDSCPLCDKAKGRHGSSTKKIDRQPVIQIDYCFHSTHKDLPLRKILSACDAQTEMRLAVVAQSPKQGDSESRVSTPRRNLRNSFSNAVEHSAYRNTIEECRYERLRRNLWTVIESSSNSASAVKRFGWSAAACIVWSVENIVAPS